MVFQIVVQIGIRQPQNELLQGLLLHFELRGVVEADVLLDDLPEGSLDGELGTGQVLSEGKKEEEGRVGDVLNGRHRGVDIVDDSGVVVVEGLILEGKVSFCGDLIHFGKQIAGRFAVGIGVLQGE